jgi:hypothetical protein
MMKKNINAIYQIKITLVDSGPPIWRRLLLNPNITLESLHSYIQAVMGWKNCHMHSFCHNQIYYGPAENDDMELEDEVTLAELLWQEKQAMKYEYDFGDSWLHKIVLEKILPPDANLAGPLCVKGKCACPPEDCGGTWGFYGLLEALEDAGHPDHENAVEWLGADFDSRAFSLVDTNARLAVLAR